MNQCCESSNWMFFHRKHRKITPCMLHLLLYITPLLCKVILLNYFTGFLSQLFHCTTEYVYCVPISIIIMKLLTILSVFWKVNIDGHCWPLPCHSWCTHGLPSHAGNNPLSIKYSQIKPLVAALSFKANTFIDLTLFKITIPTANSRFRMALTGLQGFTQQLEGL